MGIKSELDEEADLFVFLAHLSYGQSENERKSEQTLFDLPDLKEFDAAVVYGASLTFQDAIDSIYEKCSKAGIPTISVGLEKENTFSINIDNYAGMKALVEHIITAHDAKNVIYIGGAEDNADSNTRLSILKETMAEHDLTLKEDDIFYSNWETSGAKEYVKTRFISKQSLPDAIVCVNDPIAMFVTYGLEEAGYSCPEDVLVTGFDFLKDGQLFYPSISSVKQNYVAVGEQAAYILKNVFAGDKAPVNTILQCEFIPGESCGCIGYRKDDALRKDYSRTYPKLKLHEDYKSGRLHAMDSAVIEASSFKLLPERLRAIFHKSNGREGSTFYMLLDPAFKELAYKDVKEMPSFTFADNMCVMVAKENGEPIEDISFSDGALIPEYRSDGSSHMYVFMPTYIEQFVCGYVVMADNLDYFTDMFYHKLAKRFKDDLGIYRKNLQLNELNAKLNELMQKDALTCVKNRVAYENALKRMRDERALGEKEAFAVALFDINNLKIINDTLGHEKGDVYIKNSCKYICNSFKHSPVYRIGGDEFVVFIKGEDFENRKEIFESFRKDVLAFSTDINLADVERISIASGMADVDADFDGEIEAIVKKADELMYINKKEMKANRM